MIILDTDAISDLMRPRPAPTLLARLAQVPVDHQATTSVTIGELVYGAHKAARPDLYTRASQLLDGVTVFDFDRAAAEQYGRVRAELETTGQRLADPDLRIAAIALAQRATLITGNIKHFGRVPDLDVRDWLPDQA